LPGCANTEIAQLPLERREVFDERKLDSNILAAKQALDDVSRAPQV
jgi:hypothetical protein